MFLKFEELAIADISDGLTYLIEFFTPDLSKKLEKLEIPGNRFIDSFDRGLAEISFKVRVCRQFKTAERATVFLLKHIFDLSAIRKGCLQISDIDGNVYEFEGAVLQGFSTIEQIGVSLECEYKFNANGIKK